MNMNIMNMKTRLITVVSIVAVSCLTLILSSRAVAQMTQKTEGQSDQGGPSQGGPSSSQVSKASRGVGSAIVATAISPQDAVKKYPASKGKYPTGEREPHKANGLVNSPYPPHTEFDCSNVSHGGLVLDTHVNKVFVRP